MNKIKNRNTWGVNFSNIISNYSEAKILLSGTWWNIYDFELDCGLLRIDVMGKLDVFHMSDCEDIIVDGVLYKLEDVYN